jgi:hypothetical protein
MLLAESWKESNRSETKKNSMESNVDGRNNAREE